MQGTREFGNALLIALLSIALIVGALSISLVEFSPGAAPTPGSVQLPSPEPQTATWTLPPTNPPVPPAESLTPLTTSTATGTSLPPSNCQIPSGWSQITVLVSDTLDSIAARYRISASILRTANCLFSNNLLAGSKLYVPPVAPNTPVACTQGAAGWVKNYTVKAGENLYRIAVDHYTTLELIRKVNCRTSDTIYPGDILWVPSVVATRTTNPTALPGSTATAYPTDPLTETALPYTATFMPTSTVAPTATSSLTTVP